MTQIEIDEESAEILQQLAAKSGKTDQELIVKAIHQLVLSHLRGTSTTKVNQNRGHIFDAQNTIFCIDTVGRKSSLSARSREGHHQ